MLIQDKFDIIDKVHTLKENYMNTIFFDLDGTLLPLREDQFIEIYFNKLATYFAKLGFDPKEFIQVILAGIKAMRLNDGSVTNEEKFWEVFQQKTNRTQEELRREFEHFYLTEFQAVKDSTTCDERAAQIVKILKEKGYTLAITTNPLFPALATNQRVGWAGLEIEDFAIVTTFENCGFSKPNIKYYQDILDRLGKKPEEVMMIGNDATEDMIVESLGMDTYLLLDCLINEEGVDTSHFKQGTMEELLRFVTALPKTK